MKIFYFFVFLFFFVNCKSQAFITQKEFSKKTKNGIVVIEFYAEFNDDNKFQELDKLKDCKTYRVDIQKCTDIKKEYKIKSIPTVLIFDNGKETKRYIANIMLQLEATKKEIQSEIDKINLKKFQ
tara:strand:- start:2234 stop:2608 length:375 start_codon:yes stop_codon:yes gene_type:complete